jgi:hypothetical protein
VAVLTLVGQSGASVPLGAVQEVVVWSGARGTGTGVDGNCSPASARLPPPLDGTSGSPNMRLTGLLDVNDDGAVDMIAVTGNGTLMVAVNNGSGGFAAGWYSNLDYLPSLPHVLALADWDYEDGNGVVDALVGSRGSPFALLFSTALGPVSPGSLVPREATPSTLAEAVGTCAPLRAVLPLVAPCGGDVAAIPAASVLYAIVSGVSGVYVVHASQALAADGSNPSPGPGSGPGPLFSVRMVYNATTSGGAVVRRLAVLLLLRCDW